MHIALALAALFFAQVTPGQERAKSEPKITAAEYATRRADLFKQLDGDAVVFEAEKMIPGMGGIDANTPAYDYAYLTGYHKLGDLLVITAGDAFLFTEWDVEKLKAASGLTNVLERAKFEGFLKDVLSGAKTIFTRVRKDAKKLIEDNAPDATIKGSDTVRGPLNRMRMLKSEAEIKMMRKAAESTNRAHLEAMKACRSGMNEKELQTIIENKFKAEGCDGLGFPSIVGSGKNGTILHYDTNNQEISKETLIVCDIGAAYLGYVTDITRTLPSDGKFTDEQKAAYQCVLDAQKAAEKLLKPGASFGELHRAAAAVFTERELTKWSYAHSKDRSVMHGLSHYVGMAVHDSGVYAERFKPGMIITIEPGYYNKDAGWGIRIEDIYLITDDGFERMSASAPREVDEIEKIMKEAREKK